MVSKGREHKEGKNHVLFLSYPTCKWQICHSPGSFPSDNICNSSQTSALGIIWAVWMLVQVQVGHIEQPVPALFHSHWSAPEAPGCKRSVLQGSLHVIRPWNRRDAADVNTTAWQLLQEPMVMLPLPNKPQQQHSDGLQRGARGRNKGDIKGHLHLQS